MNEKNDDFLIKICGFWIDFEADFKPSILKQDKADQCHKAHTKGDDRLYRKGRYHQATDFGGAGRTYGGFWLPTANMQRCGTRRQSIMCSLQQHNNAASGEKNEGKSKKTDIRVDVCFFLAKCGSGFIDIRPKM